MKRQAPFGFFVAGACAAWFGFWMVVAVATMDPARDGGPWSSPLARGAAAVLAALSAVVVEALWRVRPWAWRASVALAVAYAAAVVAVFCTMHDGAGVAIPVLLASLVVVGPILAYVRDRSRALWPRTPPRAGAPVPRPRPPAGTPSPPHRRAGP